MESHIFPLSDEFSTARPLISTAPVFIWPLLLSYGQACAVLGGIGQRSLDALIADGDIRVKRIGRRRFVITESLVEFLRDGHPPKPSRKVRSISARPGPEAT